MRTILKVLAGSRAHGLERPDSDFDYRGVFVVPTSELLKLGAKPQSTSWAEGDERDDTQWELAPFLSLAMRCQPNALEVFGAPVEESTPAGEELRSLLPWVWSSDAVWQSYSGYASNQWKSYFDTAQSGERSRATKHALNAARALAQGRMLMETGEMVVRLGDEVREELVSFRDRLDEGSITHGQALDYIGSLRAGLREAHRREMSHQADISRVNEFLLKVRRESW